MRRSISADAECVVVGSWLRRMEGGCNGCCLRRRRDAAALNRAEEDWKAAVGMFIGDGGNDISVSWILAKGGCGSRCLWWRRDAAALDRA